MLNITPDMRIPEKDPRIFENGGEKMNEIKISRGEYEILLREKAKLELVKKAVKKDDSTYGLSSDTRVILELILGIEKAD